MALTKESALRKDQTTDGMFQHRPFAVIARIIQDYGYPQERSRLAQHFAVALSHTNPRFDRARFMRACGVQE